MRFGILRLAIALLLLAAGTLPSVTVARQTPAAGCDDIVAYTNELSATMESIASNSALDLDTDELESWTSADFTAASDLLEDAKIALDNITPPERAQTYHDLLVREVGTLSQMFDTMATVGIFGALAYTESMEDVDQQLGDEALELELECNIALYDHDDDGVEEVGLGNVIASQNSASGSQPGSSGAPGTRPNPFPMGTQIRLDEDWAIKVLDVTPDGTQTVMQANQFNDPPAAGEQFFIARIRISYAGSSSDEFSSWRLRAVGQSSVGYSQFEDDCGVVPDELANRELFTGGTIEGNVCWSISSEDADSLVMYDGDANSDSRVYLSLVSTDPDPTATATLVPLPTATATIQPPAPTSTPVATPDIAAASNSIVDVMNTAVAEIGTPYVSGTIELDAKDIAFVPTEISIYAADEPVTIQMKNTGATLHNFSIDALKIDVDVNPGETVDIVIPAGTAPGTYEYYCNVPGHKEAGMVGKLTVK